MDYASTYAFAHGVRHTRATLRTWERHPGPILGRWLAGSSLAAFGLLTAVLLVSALSTGYVQIVTLGPPFAVGDGADVLGVLGHNLLVLALHAMACVAGFIAGSSLPLQASSHSGLSRWVHEHGGRIAIAFVVCATAFSLSIQAYTLGHTLAGVAHFLRVSPALLLLGVLPHAIPELIALFLPLAAWIIASRRGEWEQLLAATFVTVAIAVPVLVIAALIEVYVSPHLFIALTHIHPPIVRWTIFDRSEGWTVTVR
jgi:Stage II sporulation protein M